MSYRTTTPWRYVDRRDKPWVVRRYRRVMRYLWKRGLLRRRRSSQSTP